LLIREPVSPDFAHAPLTGGTSRNLEQPKMNTAIRNAAFALALASAAATAHAGVKLSATRTEAFGATGYTGTFVPLNSAGATTFTFNLNSPGKKVLTYSVVCGVRSLYVDLDIIVNGVVVAPTLGVAQFCGATGNEPIMFAQRSITVAIQGVKGTNTLRILASGDSSSTEFVFRASSLVVHD
jgi:hypothetical protein